MAPLTKKSIVPVRQQVFRGLLAYGYLEGVYELIISLSFLLLISYLIVSAIGINHYVVSFAEVVEVHGKRATLLLPSDNAQDQPVHAHLHTSRKDLHAGDKIRVYVNTLDNHVVVEHKPNKLNNLGITIVIVTVALSLFIVIRFLLILKYPGLAAATPVLRALGGR